MTGVAPQTFDGDKDRRPFEHLHQPIEESFMIVVFRLKIFFKNALGVANGLNG